MVSNDYAKFMATAPHPGLERTLKLSRDPIKWTEQTRTLRDGTRFSFEGREYLKQIYREQTPEVYIVKGRQTELTEALVNLLVHNAQRYPGTVSLFMSSTWDKTYTFSNLRIRDWALNHSEIWRKFLPIKNHFTRQITLLNGSKGYFRSAFNKYEEARTFPVDFLYLDEMQSQEVEYIDTATESMSHSKHKRLFGVGTGDYEDTEWYNRWHKGTQFKWDHEAGSWIKSANGSSTIHSYHIPQTIVPWITDKDIEDKFNKAQSRNEAIKEIMGWWVVGVKKPITTKMVRALYDHQFAMVDPESLGKVRDKGPIFVGIDLGGGTRSHTVFWAVQAIKQDIPIMRVLYATAIDDKDVEVQADKLIRLIELFEPTKGVIDEGGGTRQLQKVEDRFLGLIHKCRYTNDHDRPLNIDDLTSKNLVRANRTYSIDNLIDLMSRFHTYPKAPKPVSRYRIPYAIPKEIEWIVPHFTCITSKPMKSSTGQEYIKYDKEPADVHDALMAANYANIAFQIYKRESESTFAYGVGTMK